MSRLTWIERSHGWRAGPYEIELVAPHLWVCTRNDGRGLVTVEMTAGSLSALKRRVERLDFRRQCQRKSQLYLIGFMTCMLAVAASSVSDGETAPLLVVGFSIAGLVAAIRAVDAVIQRSWESLRLTYQ